MCTVVCRYLQEPEVYPFSHGLSYTAFVYRNLVLTPNHNAMDPNGFVAQVEVHNTGVLVMCMCAMMSLVANVLVCFSTEAE